MTLLSDTIKLPTRLPRKSEASTPTVWPAEVEVILSAMDAATKSADERRDQARLPYRVRAQLTLFADDPNTSARTLYTRDVDQRGLGFITQSRLPLGYGGWVELPAPSGRKMKIPCTLFRCRQTVPGWYEGALYFNREQWIFVPEL